VDFPDPERPVIQKTAGREPVIRIRSAVEVRERYGVMFSAMGQVPALSTIIQITL